MPDEDARSMSTDPSSLSYSAYSDLAEMPRVLQRALERAGAGVRTRPASGGFSLVEQIWHLADLEREGYGERIRRILGETAPHLADFEGDRIARERRYVELDPREGLVMFSAARNANLSALRRATSADFARTATQDEVGPITLADVPRMMSEHDRGHRAEIEDLLSEIAR
jgi:hypothetical protein